MRPPQVQVHMAVQPRSPALDNSNIKMLTCGFVEVYRRFTCVYRWSQQVLLKRRHNFTGLHGSITRKTTFFILLSMKTSNPTTQIQCFPVERITFRTPCVPGGQVGNYCFLARLKEVSLSTRTGRHNGSVASSVS